MYTYQDFKKEKDVITAITNAITYHLNSDMYKTALSADEYDHQRNETIYNYVKMIFTMTGSPVEDYTASNNKIASNFFHRLNTQRCNYLLGKGVSFTKHKEEQIDEKGAYTIIDTTKDFLGDKFDTDLKKAGYYSLIHGISFGFWNYDRLHVYPLTQFVPLWDEDTGVLRAGIRFWRIDPNKPLIAVLFEEDGRTKYKSKANVGIDLEEVEPKQPYKTLIQRTEIDGEEVISEDNYNGALPIIPLWGSNLHQSTLVGMKNSIDSFDLIRSGFANDLSDCAQIYWILENCGGMSDAELARFRDRLKINHMAVVDTDNSKATPYTQEIPYSARQAYLNEIRAGIYEDFGALDVHAVDANSTNDHLEAAYQPLDEEADDFEYQVIEFIQQILALNGIDDMPTFNRNRISNQPERTNMILSAANYLDDETVLQKLPFITVDEVSGILAKKDEFDMNKFVEAKEDALDVEDELNDPNDDEE